MFHSTASIYFPIIYNPIDTITFSIMISTINLKEGKDCIASSWGDAISNQMSSSRLWDQRSRRIIRSRDITFDETTMRQSLLAAADGAAGAGGPDLKGLIAKFVLAGKTKTEQLDRIKDLFSTSSGLGESAGGMGAETWALLIDNRYRIWEARLAIIVSKIEYAGLTHKNH